jgi:hypothetical protein
LKFRNTWIVLLLAALLGGWVYWHEVRGERQRADRRADAAKLLGIDPAQVTAVRITHTGTLHELQKRGGAWYLMRPIPAPCDPATMTAFLDTLGAALREDEVGRGNLPRYGLDAPAAVVEVDAGGATRRLQLGRINPQQTLVYALVDDDPEVVLTTSSLLTFAVANAFGWRDKRIVDIDPETVQRLEFRTLQDGTLAIRRDPRFGWRVEGDPAWRVDPVAAQSLVIGFSRLQAVAVAAENKAEAGRFGLGNRRFGMQVQTGGPAVGDLVLGFSDGEGAYFGMVPDKPEVWKVDATLVDAMVRLVRAPRDTRALMPFDPEKIDRIQVVAPEDRFELRRRSAQDWKVVSSTRYDSTLALGTGMVDALLTDLVTLEVAGYPEQQPAASHYEPPRVQVRLFSGTREVSGLDLGTKAPGSLNAFARGPGEPAVFLVSPAALLKVPFDLERLRADEEPAPEGANRG